MVCYLISNREMEWPVGKIKRIMGFILEMVGKEIKYLILSLECVFKRVI